MFERYTEKARRVIFFARYEAKQFGGPYVEVEHILLGLLREDTALAGRLSHSPLSPEKLRHRIVGAWPASTRFSLSVDMPLSVGAKAALKSAGEEAERCGHNNIDTEHLLLGILGQEDTLAARLLDEAGIEIAKLRADTRRADRYPGRKGVPLPTSNEDYIEIHGELFSFTSIREFSEHYRKFHWERRRWTPRDALAGRSDKKLFLYSGQTYDAEHFELVRGGWSEDHCVICWWKLTTSESAEQGEGYTNGQDWLCAECFQRFVGRERPADRQASA